MNKLFIAFVLFISCSSFVYAQQVNEKTEFDKLLPGLHEIQVREIVGVPFRVEPFVTIKNGTKDTTTYWVYPNLYTLAFKNHFLEYVQRDRYQFLQHVQQWNNPKNNEGIRLKYGR